MIRKAQINLTLLYSAIFLVLFWSLSFGIYEWMNSFLGDRSRNYHEIRSYQIHQEPSSDVIMDSLRNIILMIDGILLVTIPAITWFLTGNSLAPVKEAQKRERQFLTDASHELRTPLSILRAEMEVALNRKRTVDEYQQVLKSNKEEVEELAALVENLLYISREQTKYSSPINEKLDLTDLIAERVANLQQKVKQKQLTLTIHPSKTNPMIHGNQQLLKRLFTNLIDNAIKYTEKGSITVTVKQVKDATNVAITDTGIGIPKEQQEKIFDRFYRADESRSEQGYGLGLSIAKQIMDVHNGWIAVKSDPGKGTTMTLTFPIKQAQEKNLS